MSSSSPPFPAASAILTSYLTQLRLPTMAASCAAVAREAAASNLDYLAFLTLLCGQEVAQREQTQAARRIGQAQFPWPKTLDEFDFRAAPAVQQAAVLQLTTGRSCGRRRTGSYWAGQAWGKPTCSAASAARCASGAFGCASARRRRW